MPGLFPNPSAAPEAFRPGDQVRWYIGDAHISPYVGTVTAVHPKLVKVDVEFPVGGNQRLSPEDLILVTRFTGESVLGDNIGGYEGYDKNKSEECYGTPEHNLRALSLGASSKGASAKEVPSAKLVAKKFATDVVEPIAEDLLACHRNGWCDVRAYQTIYAKYASNCSDVFMRGAVKKVYAALKPGRWTTENTELDVWSERDRNYVILKDKASGKSIMEWWDEDVHEAVEEGFLTMGKGKDRLHQDAVDYANERQLKPRSLD